MLLLKKKPSRSVEELLVALFTYLQAVMYLKLNHFVFSKVTQLFIIFLTLLYIFQHFTGVCSLSSTSSFPASVVEWELRCG